jgi:ketosteroid isomerase-like protein
MFAETEVTMAHDFLKEQIMQTTHETMEYIYREWDDALSKLDVDRLLELYAPDAIIGKPARAPFVENRPRDPSWP